MTVPKEVLEILVCPKCRAPVRLTPDESGIKCLGCHRVYPIRDGVPWMLVEEARVEED